MNDEILFVNRTGVKLIMQDVHVINASTGSGRPGNKRYEFPPNGWKPLSKTTFSMEAIKRRKILNVHVKIEGRVPLTFRPWDFGGCKVMIFVIGEDNKLTSNYVPDGTASAKGFANWVWSMFPCCVSEAIIEALIAEAKPWKPEVKPEAEPEVEPEAKPEVEPEAKPEVKTEAEPEVEPGVEHVV